jgi:hypothetical protein
MFRKKVTQNPSEDLGRYKASLLADVKKCYSFGLHATKICTVR